MRLSHYFSFRDFDVMKLFLFSCLFIISVSAQDKTNLGETKAQEQVMPQKKEMKEPPKITPVEKDHLKREIQPTYHSEDTPLQKKLEKEPGPFKKLYWKYHHSASLGYRRDRQKFADPSTKQSVNSRNTMQLILDTHLEAHHMVFKLTGQYGWLLDGQYNYTARGPGNDFPGGTIFHSNFKLGGGYTTDVYGSAGVRINLYSKPKFTFSFIPSAGYKYSHVKNFAEGTDRNDDLIPFTAPGFIGFSEGTLPKPNQQDWFGPFLEGRFGFRFLEKVNWDLYYQFHWTALRAKSHEAINRFFRDPNIPSAPLVQLTEKSTTYKSRINYGQLGGTYLRYIATTGFNFGFLFEGLAVYSTTAGLRTKTQVDNLLPLPENRVEQSVDQRGSIHWVSYQVSIFLGHQW